ncbi:hypothetical protein KEM52_002336 [Ascosphaera acerosa]|nr:hypothetical protein KEM52_002336 [Ascosphaera acerosa]
MLDTGRLILRDEGVRGFYRGLAPMLLGYLPTWAVYMTVYDMARQVFGSARDDGSSSSSSSSSDARWWLARMSASVTAGACSTVATNPIWVVKTRLMSQSQSQSQSHSHSLQRPAATTSTSDGAFAARAALASPAWGYRGTLDACAKIYRAEGLRAFYSGLTPALLGLSHVAIQFPLYEYFKKRFTGLEIGEAPPQQQQTGREAGRRMGDSEDASPSLLSSSHWLGISAATFLSKICASTITYPHEVLRTRLQTQQRYLPPDRFGHHGASVGSSGGGGADHHRRRPHDSHSHSHPVTAAASSDGMANRPRYRGVLQSCKTILREEGWRAFYAGIGVNLFRAVPSAMTTMLTYEYLKGLIGWMQREGEGRLLELQMLEE